MHTPMHSIISYKKIRFKGNFKIFDIKLLISFRFGNANSINTVHLVLHPHGIAPMYFLKIGFVVAGLGFYSYYIHQGNISDNVRKRKMLCIQKDFIHILKDGCNSAWVQFLVYQLIHV